MIYEKYLCEHYLHIKVQFKNSIGEGKIKNKKSAYSLWKYMS